MAYKTKTLEKQALAAIKENNLVFDADVIAFLPCSKTTYYDKKLNESDLIKKALETNRAALKIRLRRKWADSDNPTVQIALYKLIASPEELERLSNSKITVENTQSPPEPFKGFSFLPGDKKTYNDTN